MGTSSPNAIDRFLQGAREAQQSPWRAGARVMLGGVRRAIPPLRTVVTRIDARGTKIRADLCDPLGLTLYRYGVRNPEAALIQAVLRRGDVFVDGGAHIGLFTLLAAASVGDTGHVVACEPNPDTFALLTSNIELNRFAWVTAHNVALADEAGEAKFVSFGAGSALSSFAPESETSGKTITVRVQSLDDVTAAFRSRVRLVKLDLEGAEVRALRGAPALLAARPDFLVEVEPDHLARQGTTPDDLHEIFAPAGYRAYAITGHARQPDLVPLREYERPFGNPNVFLTAGSVPLPARRSS